jgi:hypothetical protein
LGIVCVRDTDVLLFGTSEHLVVEEKEWRRVEMIVRSVLLHVIVMVHCPSNLDWASGALGISRTVFYFYFAGSKSMFRS